MTPNAVAAAPVRSTDRIDTLILTGAALSVLLIESPAPDWRLAIAGIPFNPLIFLCVSLFACSLSTFTASMQMLAFPLACVVLSTTYPLMMSTDFTYGVSKAACPILSTVLAFCLLRHLLSTQPPGTVGKCFIFFLLMLLGATLLYKVRHGFFDRQTLFLLNGPIVFGRLMGWGFVLAMCFFDGLKRLLICAIFAAAVTWTGSKGPLVSMIMVAILVGSRSWIGRLGLLGLLLITVVFHEQLLTIGSAFPPLARVTSVLSGVSSDANVTEYSPGSVAPRLSMVITSLRIISEHPWGVGLGGWSAAARTTDAEYPHNFFLEIYSEFGIFLGTVLCIPYLMFILRGWGPWFVVALFFMINQQCSGDLLDSRYWLMFGLLHYYEGAHYQTGRRPGFRPTLSRR